MSLYREIFNFIKNDAKVFEFREDAWAFAENHEPSVMVLVVTHPKTMYREYQLHTKKRSWFGVKNSVSAIDKNDVTVAEWNALEDVMYFKVLQFAE